MLGRTTFPGDAVADGGDRSAERRAARERVTCWTGDGTGVEPSPGAPPHPARTTPGPRLDALEELFGQVEEGTPAAATPAP